MQQAWVPTVDRMEHLWSAPIHLVQNRGRGRLAQGTREWTDYRAEATLTPYLNAACGLTVRVQDPTRY